MLTSAQAKFLSGVDLDITNADFPFNTSCGDFEERWINENLSVCIIGSATTSTPANATSSPSTETSVKSGATDGTGLVVAIAVGAGIISLVVGATLFKQWRNDSSSRSRMRGR